MSDRGSLLSSAVSHIQSTFAVTDTDATRHAREFLDLIEAKGGSLSGFDAESLALAIDKHLGRSLVWKDHERKAVVEAASQATATAYEAFINASKRRKW
jgi:hypothetical protein